MAPMNTYTEERNGPLETSPTTPRVSADIHSSLVRTLWTEESFRTLERTAEEDANLAFKLSSASDMAQSTDDRLSGFATAPYITSASQNAAAKFRSVRCIN
jgi:hypothetical protein